MKPNVNRRNGVSSTVDMPSACMKDVGIVPEVIKTGNRTDQEKEQHFVDDVVSWHGFFPGPVKQ